MHLIDKSVGFHGSVPIVAGTIPLALGAAMACRLQASPSIAVAYLGDGACEEGVFHECLNLASLNKEPILFVVENNLFASHMHISQRQQSSSTTRFAEAHDIPSLCVDGNNLSTLLSASRKLVSKIRDGNGPAFLEAVTYRWYGHVDWREDIDVGVNRSKADVATWRKRDPVARLYQALANASLISPKEFSDLKQSIASQVSSQWSLALEQPSPLSSTLLDKVYAC